MLTRRRSPISPVALWVIFCAVCNAAGWLLSAVGMLDFTGYLAALLVTAAVAGGWWAWKKPTLRCGLRARRFRRVFPLAFSVIAVLALAGGFIHAPNNYDALAYRTPRVLHWLAEGHWHWIHTDFHRLNTRGAGIEWITAPLLVFTGTDRFFFLINAVSFLLLPGICFSLLTRLGVRPKVAWHWMWILPTGYCFLLQAGSISNDLFGATLAMAAIDFALRASREKSAPAAWISILAAALMTSGKGFNLLLLLPWGLAILPASLALIRRPVPTFLVGLVALLVSMLPTAVLNDRYCGDWKGLKAEAVDLSTGEPMLHLGVNSLLLSLHNLNPPLNPIAGVWNRAVKSVVPPAWTAKLDSQFEKSAAEFTLGEIQMEETCGIGFGVSVLVLAVLAGGIPLRWPRKHPWVTILTRPSFLVPAATWVVILYFMTQSGLSCPARYLAPSYAVLVVPVLCLPRAGKLLARRWWRGLAMLGFGLAALLLIAYPARPLWPAVTLLKVFHADQSSSPILKRIWAVYSVYGARSDGFAPVRATLGWQPEVLGMVTFDDPETSIWRPFGSRRIVHVTHDDDAAILRKNGIREVLVSEFIVTNHQASSMEKWLARFDAEIVTSFELELRASLGPTPWHLVRIRETPNP